MPLLARFVLAFGVFVGGWGGGGGRGLFFLGFRGLRGSVRIFRACWVFQECFPDVRGFCEIFWLFQGGRYSSFRTLLSAFVFPFLRFFSPFAFYF